MLRKNLETRVEPLPAENQLKPPVKLNKKNIIILVVCLLVVVVVGYALLVKSSPFSLFPKASEVMSDKELQTLVNKVARHIVIKTDEKPTVATIQDADLLRTQNPDFYKDAVVGDNLLIWSDKAVLYSIKQDKILSVLPINLAANEGMNTNQVATSTEEAVIEVRNGTKTAGLAKTVAERLKSASLNVSIVGSAVKNYDKTLIMVAPGKPLTNTATKIQELTGGNFSPMPLGEAAMKGDILVIVGADYKN